MIMDVSRFCYKRNCRFFADGPAQTIVWYRAPVGAKVFPTWHLFGSINYGDEPEQSLGQVGEQFGESPRWWQGDTPPTARGLAYFGPLEFFQQGQPVPLAAPIQRDPWGLAVACTGGNLVGAIDVDSTDVFDGPHVVTFTTPGADTWTCPDDVFNVTVQAIGAGMFTNGFVPPTNGGLGAGGGAYARSYLPVVPGTVYALQVGDGGLASTPILRETWFDSTATLLANGGGQSVSALYQEPGAAGLSVGDMLLDGGWGANAPGGLTKGGGGSSAGNSQVGDYQPPVPSTNVGGGPFAPGGQGGLGGTALHGAFAGGAPGAGAGGQIAVHKTLAPGGDGLVIISW